MYIITKDYICNGEGDGDYGPDDITDDDTKLLKLVAEGKAPAGTESEYFHMYDDDGERYYSGYYVVSDGSDELEPLECYGMPNAGCTEIRMRNKEGEFETV